MLFVLCDPIPLPFIPSRPLDRLGIYPSTGSGSTTGEGKFYLSIENLVLRARSEIFGSAIDEIVS
jgi:hypothetical protein